MLESLAKSTSGFIGTAMPISQCKHVKGAVVNQQRTTGFIIIVDLIDT